MILEFDRFGVVKSPDEETKFNEMLKKIKHLLDNESLKKQWEVKRQKLLSDKIDVTAFLVWFVENYPNSNQIMKDKPNYQNRFK